MPMPPHLPNEDGQLSAPPMTEHAGRRTAGEEPFLSSGARPSAGNAVTRPAADASSGRARKKASRRSADEGRQGTLVLRGKPQAKQKEFFDAREPYVAYGGARGGGKSWALRRKLVLMCLYYPELSALLIRRSFPELRENHVRPLCSELREFAKYSETKKTFEFPNGSRLMLGYCDDENDVLRYQGQEFDVIALDEATQLTEYQFQTFKGCLRGVSGCPKRLYLTCNPGGVGHAWVKRLFIDRDFRPGEEPADYRFIPASVYDNGILLKNDPGYLSRLESLPNGLREAWLEGKWEVFAGQYFPEFDRSLHVTSPFAIGPEATRVCAIDYGLDMLAALFIALFPDGHAYVYDEVYESGLIVSEAAKAIREKADGVTSFIAPADLWSRQKDSGKSIAELFADGGVYLTKITPNRIQGWLTLKEWLKPVETDGERDAALKIFPGCVNLLRTLPLLSHDPSGSGDVAVNPHELTHAPDALRYFVSSRQTFPTLRTLSEKKKKLPASLSQRTIRRLR